MRVFEAVFNQWDQTQPGNILTQRALQGI